MAEPIITFIGAGNMASSLIGGLLEKGRAPASIRAADPSAAQRQAVAERFGIVTCEHNVEALAGCGTAVLAVKPQMMAAVARACSAALREAAPLIISVAAGIRTADIRRWLGYPAALVRCMPNTPALLGCGATGLYAGEGVDDAQRRLAETILAAAGITEWVADEALLDAVTGISGSGPAYYFLMMEAMETAGREMGLPADTARRLVLQTALGAARMALESGEAPGTLRERVTSPGGTTQRAVQALRDGGMERLVSGAALAARDRAAEMADEFGGQ